MATILLAWELGGGMGHLLPLRGIGEVLVKRGHRVIAAVRDLSRVGQLFAGSGIAFLQAPIYQGKRMAAGERVSGFAHILASTCFGDDGVMGKLFEAWNDVLDQVKPDLLVADHAPSALLAVRGKTIPCVNMGLAFCCPPDVSPLPYWWSSREESPAEEVATFEESLLQRVNRLLENKGRPRLKRLSQLFNQIDDVVLATYRELDPYGDRAKGRYWGHWHVGSGVEPVWPEGAGPKIYAYLKPFPALEGLLNELRRMNCPALVLSGGISLALQARYASELLRFEERPLHMGQVAARCDVAILNAGHGTMASLLLAGKPLLLVPLYTEQLLNSQGVERLGAGRWVLPNERGRVGLMLEDVVSRESYREAAQGFAKRYAGFLPGQQLPALADRLEGLVGKKPRHCTAAAAAVS